MKRWMHGLLILALVAALLCGCGGNRGVSLTGQWTADTATVQGVTYKFADMGVSMTLDFDSAGGFTMRTLQDGYLDTVTGRYTFSGGSGTLTGNGETLRFTVSGGALVLDDGMGTDTTIRMVR